MKRFLVFVSLFLLPSFLFSSTTFQKTFGDTAKDVGYGILQLPDNQYLIIGYTYSFGAKGMDGYLIDMDGSGKMLWQENIDLGGDEFLRHGVLLPDGDILLTGYSRADASSPTDLLLLKINHSGQVLWSKIYGGSGTDLGWDIQASPDGNYVVSGYTNSYGAGQYDVWILKIDSEGDTLWTALAGGTGDDEGRGCAVDGKGNIYVSAKSYSFFAPDMYMIKLHSDGSKAWLKSFSSTGWTEGYDVCIADSNAVFAGYGYWGNHDMLLVDMNSSGDTLFTCHAGLSNDDYAFAISPTSDKGFVMVGRSTSFGGGNKGMILKVDAQGKEQWQNAWGGDQEDMLWDVLETDDKGYLAVGFTKSFGQGDADVYVVKTDSAGNVTGIAPSKQYVASGFMLEQNYPNPFNPTTTISYQINGNKRQYVHLAVYDISGKLIVNLAQGWQSAGKHHFRFNGQNLPSGIYVYQLSVGKFSQSKKMVLLK